MTIHVHAIRNVIGCLESPRIESGRLMEAAQSFRTETMDTPFTQSHGHWRDN